MPRLRVAGQPAALLRHLSTSRLSQSTLIQQRYLISRQFRTSAYLCEKDSRTARWSQHHPQGQSGPPRSELSKQFGFAFDIDGVLYQGKTPVAGARAALRNIRSQGIRYVFLTNGGGHPEESKVKSLSERLKIGDEEDVVRDRVILSHTPMSGWSEQAKEETVLVTGSHPEDARQVAEQYGFKRVVTPADIIAANPKIYPFAHLRDSLHSVSRPLPDQKQVLTPDDPYSKDIPGNALKIDKIFVWNDPRDWSLDIQLIYDLLISHRGYFGTISTSNGDLSLPNNGWQQDGQPALWISNLDLLWRTDFPVNRFGTGAFVEALKGVFSASTNGTPLRFSALGKPSQTTYAYAHERLLEYYRDLPRVAVGGDVAGRRTPLRRVYMIGDNPESDIRGGNEFEAGDGTEWRSILVRTGVWKATEVEREPRYKPDVIVDDVVDGVVWAMREEGMEMSREKILKGEA